MTASIESPTDVRLALLERRYLPLPVRGKIPEEKEWQLKRQQTNNREITLWGRVFPYAQNTGILTRNTPALDLDLLNAEAADAAEQLVAELFDGQYLLVRIGRAPKRALAFQIVGEPFKKILVDLISPDGTDAKKEKIEFLCDGQQLVVHGQHPETQQPYSWRGTALWDIPHGDLPGITADQAQQLVDDIVELLITDFGYQRKGKAKPSQAGIRQGANGLYESGPALQSNHDPAPWGDLISNILTGHELHDSIRDLAAKMVAAKTEGGAIVKLLRDLMERSAAPRDARWQRRNSDIPRAVSTAEKYRRPDDKAPKPVIKAWRVTAIDMHGVRKMIFEPITFLVKGVIPSRGVCVIAAKPKAGKSWLVLDIALGATMNRFVLGDIKPEQGDVLYLALEDSLQRLQSRTEKVLQGTVSGDEWPKGLTVATAWRRIDEGGMDDIREWVADVRAAGRNVASVAIDVLKCIRPPKKPGQQDYDADYEAIKMLHDLAVELNILILVVHHTRKAAADDLLDKVSGSFGLTGAADTILVIEKQGQNTVFDIRGRDVEANTLAVEFNKETCRWTILGNAEELRRSHTRSEIIDALSDGPMGPTDVAKVTGLTSANVKMTLGRMVKSGEVVQRGRGKYVLAETLADRVTL